MTQDAVAALLGIKRQNVSAPERNALRKMGELMGDESNWQFEPQLAIRAGRWNGKTIVRVA